MMFVGIALIICSLIYSILVSVIYFSRPHLKSEETEIYKRLCEAQSVGKEISIITKNKERYKYTKLN